MALNEENIYAFQGLAPGPSILIIGGTHGNERTGIEVVRRLIDDLKSGKRTVLAGKLTLALGNPAAVEQNVRAIEGRDLNRYFSDEAFSANDGSYEHARAKILAQYIQEAEVVLDIHATNKPSVPFAASKNDQAHRNVYRWFTPSCVLVDPKYIFGGGGPVAIEEYADSLGKVGVCLETGWVQDESVLPQVFDSVVNFLAYAGILDGQKMEPPQVRAEVYELFEAIVSDERPFEFAPDRGLKSFEPIQAGDVICWRGSEPVVAAESGVILFPKLPEHQSEGKPVCYLARKV